MPTSTRNHDVSYFAVREVNINVSAVLMLQHGHRQEVASQAPDITPGFCEKD